jgi:hypothetical protein
MRVIVAPGDPAPVEIAHPALLVSQTGAGPIAAARAAAAEAAAKKADAARLAAVTASQEAARAMVPVRVAENLKRRTEEQLAAAEAALASASSKEATEQAERAKAQALARIAELQAQWTAAKAALQPKLDAVPPARAAAVAAEAVRAAAAAEALEAARELEPVSVFISRNSQRLHVRRAFAPVLEFPVTILDAERPIGTHVFTAMERTSSTDLRWSVVSLDSGRPAVNEARARAGGARDPARPNGPSGATAALDRIVMPQDALDAIAGMASPRSSLIISDEPLSHETGKDTEFVVILSGEPQGSMKVRRRVPSNAIRYDRPPARIAGPYSTW